VIVILWPPCVADADIIFMGALCNRGPLYFCPVVSSFYLFSLPNLSRRRSDVYHTYFDTWCGPSAKLECRSETCCLRLAGNAGPKKNRQKVVIWAPSHNFVGLYLHNYVSTIGKKLVKQHYLLHVSAQYGELWPTSA